MTPKRRLHPLLLVAALLTWGNLNSTRASSIPPTVLPSPDTPISSVIIDEAGSRRISSSSSSSVNGQHVRGHDPPGSPVNLFTPDEFQFYTLNGQGQLVMKQMTKQEIQSMIAAGSGGPAASGNLPVDLGHQQSSLAIDAEPKVSDVVQNVQKVLKSELNKPVKVHTSSSSIPGSVNSQWTNMLPYILSGGSVDQQDVSQDTGIVLPALEDDESYVDMIPLQSSKPTKNQSASEPNYVPVHSTNSEQMIKPVSVKPTKGSSEKPIYLLGNMALDSGILGEQNTYVVPTKGKPNRPSIAPTYHKYTTSKPSVKDTPTINKKNATDSKPTLYIPLSVSSPLLTGSQNQEDNSVPTYGFKPNKQEQEIKKHNISTDSLTSVTTKKASMSSLTYPDEIGFTRVPMIQVPVISADKISTSTQRPNPQQTPMFEKLPTISPASMTSTDVKLTSHSSTMNLGPISGFKKPDNSYKPSTSYHPVYEPEFEPSSAALPSSTTRHPVYEPVTKPFKISTSTTYHPVYRPMLSSSTRHPIYELSTKMNTANFKPSFSRRPVFETSTSKASFPTVEIITKPTTKYPNDIYTAGKSSTSSTEFTTKPTTQAAAVKDTTLQTKSTLKSSTRVTNGVIEVSSTQESTIRDEVKDLSPVYVVQQLLESEKYPSMPSAPQSLDNTVSKEGYDILEKHPMLNSSDIDTNEELTESYNTYNEDKYTVTYTDTNDNLPVKSTVYPDVSKYGQDISYTVEPIKTETESDAQTTIYITERSTQPQPMNVVTTHYRKPEESTTFETTSIVPQNDVDFQLNENVKKTGTLYAQTENTPLLLSEIITSKYEVSSIKPVSSNETRVNKDTVKTHQNDKTEEKSSTTVYMSESEQTQSWSESEMTTQIIPVKENVTEILIAEYDSGKEMEKKTMTIEAVTKKTEITTKPIQDSTESKSEYSELPVDYTTPINLSIDSEKREEISGNLDTLDNIDEPIQLLERTTNVPLGLNKETIEKVTTTVEDKKDFSEFVTDTVTISNPENKKPFETVSKKNNENSLVLTENNVTKHTDPNQTKPVTEEIISTSNPLTESNVTPFYDKMETTTENVVDKQTEKLNIFIDKLKIQSMEEEVSTVKVIPIYDDDTSIYTLISENPDRIKFADENSMTIKSIPDNQEASKSTIFSVKTTQYSKVPSTVTLSIPAQTTQSELLQDTVLPGLEETFNNYMREHYDPNLSPTGLPDDISRMTTFSPEIVKGPSNNGNKATIWPTTILDYMTTGQPDDFVDSEFPKIQSSAVMNALDNIDEKRTESVTTAFKDSSSTENLNDKNSGFTTINPLMREKNKVETPIIYLDLANSEANKQNVPPLQINKDFVNNSSLTRIKIKNPVMDIDKIISEAQIQTQTSTPSIYTYTLTYENRPANNIASGIIAGFPVYEQMKPSTEQTPGTTLYEIIARPKKPILKQKPIEEKKTFDNEKFENNIISQSNWTTSFSTTDRRTATESIDLTSTIIPSADLESTIYQTTETPNYESYTQISFESLPIVNKTSGEMYDPPLEKINDLINQLKNTPSEHASIGYDFTNGVETTIVPMDRFETSMTESNPVPIDETLTTIIGDSFKTSTESQSDAYVIIQTLAHSKPVQSNTEATTRQSTNKESTTVSTTATTLNVLKTKPATIPNTTTVLTVVKQSTTGKPYVISTYNITKASFDNIQSTIDKSAGRINLEEEKNKMQPSVKPTEPTKFPTKNKHHYSTIRRGTPSGSQNYSRKTTKAPIKEVAIIEHTTSKPIDDAKETSSKWTLIPQRGIEKIEDQPEVKKLPAASSKEGAQPIISQIVSLDHASGAIGLDQSNKALDKDVAEFLNMCNELSFKFWTLANSGLSSSRSVTMSPFGMISTLAMIFLGARGLTSNQMNDILKLDDVVTFNPHLVFQNITDTVTLARGQGIENAAFVRALFADRLKVRRIIPFYKEQTQQFYEGAVVDINFSTAGDILRRRTNLLIRKQTGGRIKDFMKQHTLPLRSPLTALSANVFQTSCDGPEASSEGRDGEMYFAVSQTVKQRKLVPIPAVVWKSGVSAGYEPSLDATAVALAESKRPVSLIMVMPGQQGLTAPGDNLERLENRLFGNPADNALEKLLKVIIPRRVELQMPKFSQRSIVNVTAALKKMGFDQLFTKTADLKGINGAGHDLYLADMLQMNLFCACGDENKLGGKHLSETYPGTPSRHNRAWEVLSNVYDNEVNDLAENRGTENSEVSEECPEDDESENWSGSNEQLERINGLRQKMHQKRLRWFTSSRRTRCRTRRQAEAEKPRMKMDKPFLYLIRHNLSGLILHIGRFNPKNQS